MMVDHYEITSLLYRQYIITASNSAQGLLIASGCVPFGSHLRVAIFEVDANQIIRVGLGLLPSSCLDIEFVQIFFHPKLLSSLFESLSSLGALGRAFSGDRY